MDATATKVLKCKDAPCVRECQSRTRTHANIHANNLQFNTVLGRMHSTGAASSDRVSFRPTRCSHLPTVPASVFSHAQCNPKTCKFPCRINANPLRIAGARTRANTNFTFVFIVFGRARVRDRTASSWNACSCPATVRGNKFIRNLSRTRRFRVPPTRETHLVFGGRTARACVRAWRLFTYEPQTQKRVLT